MLQTVVGQRQVSALEGRSLKQEHRVQHSKPVCRDRQKPLVPVTRALSESLIYPPHTQPPGVFSPVHPGLNHPP